MATGDKLVTLEELKTAKDAIESEIPPLANNLTTTATGSALDARQGKVLKDAIDANTNTSGSGYCKMPDGTLIQWGTINVDNVAINNAWGNIYESAQISAGVTFPIRFIEDPVVVALAQTTPTSWLENITNGKSNIGSFYLLRGTSNSGVSGAVYWTAIGRWK